MGGAREPLAYATVYSSYFGNMDLTRKDTRHHHINCKVEVVNNLGQLPICYSLAYIPIYSYVTKNGRHGSSAACVMHLCNVGKMEKNRKHGPLFQLGNFHTLLASLVITQDKLELN